MGDEDKERITNLNEVALWDSQIEVGPMTSQFSSGTRKLARQSASNGNLDGTAISVRFQNAATPQPFRSLRFQKRTFTAPRIMQFNTFRRTKYLAAF